MALRSSLMPAMRILDPKFCDIQVHEVLERGLKYNITSSPEMLKQATRHWGGPARLHDLFRKLMRGNPTLA